MSSTAPNLATLAEHVAHHGQALRRRSAQEIAEHVHAAWSLIADPERALGREARERLPNSTGLSLPMVAWALEQTFRSLDTLPSVAQRITAPEGCVDAPFRLGAIVLAGNVFTACVQPISMGLICGVPLMIKASSRDDVLPHLFARAFREVAQDLSEAIAVVSTARDALVNDSSLWSRVDVVSAYGSDASLLQIRAQLPANASFIPHGHGLSVGYVGTAALSDERQAREAANAFAWDVAAYDQRGCLSPHLIAVARGGEVDGLRFARILAEELDTVQSVLPRGSLPAEIGAAQIQWRGLLAARGALFEGTASAVGYEPEPTVRVSPGWRNVAVIDMDDANKLASLVHPLGPHLKCIGVAGEAPSTVARALTATVAPRICVAGAMQRPSLISLADGQLPWHGFTRYLSTAKR